MALTSTPTSPGTQIVLWSLQSWKDACRSLPSFVPQSLKAPPTHPQRCTWPCKGAHTSGALLLGHYHWWLLSLQSTSWSENLRPLLHSSSSRLGLRMSLGWNWALLRDASYEKISTHSWPCSLFLLTWILSWLGQVSLKCKFNNNLTFITAPTSNKKPCRKLTPLLDGANNNNMFCQVFIPTYEQWVGAQVSPGWYQIILPFINTLQTIWDLSHPTLNYEGKWCSLQLHTCLYSLSFEKGRGGCPSNSWLWIGCTTPL